jgi:hypothetical protein
MWKRKKEMWQRWHMRILASGRHPLVVVAEGLDLLLVNAGGDIGDEGGEPPAI